MNTAERLVRRLSGLGRTCAAAESCTGGGVGSAITAVPGASAVFRGGVVSYDNSVKRDVLGVPEEILKTKGAVSRECAEAMARGARNLLKSDFAVSVTGIAGPDGGSAEKPVGLVWFGCASCEGVKAENVIFPGDRAAVRVAAVEHALKMIVEAADRKVFTLADVRTALDGGCRVLLMVRHAERPPISDDDPTFGELLPITDTGCETARRFGEMLRPYAGDVQFLSSPLRRTVMTAECIAEGMGIPGANIPTAPELGNSSFYFTDQREVYELFSRNDFFEEIFRYMARGTQRGFREMHEASDMLEKWCLERFTARLGIFATHDLYNGVFLHVRGVETRFTRENWLRFLDSAAIIIEPDGTRRYALVRAGLSDRCTGVASTQAWRPRPDRGTSGSRDASA